MDRGLVVKHLKSQDPSGISRQLESDEGLEALTHKTYKGKGAISRRKRNILFPSGVKLCSQETVDQAIENHLKYFHQRGKLFHYCISWALGIHYDLESIHLQSLLFSQMN